MFNKSLALLSLLLTTESAIAELRAKKTNNVIRSKKDTVDVIKNIPINVVRKLNSDTCESETLDLMKNQDIIDAMANVPSSPADYSSDSFCSFSNAKATCDFKDAFSMLETACDNAGGQFLEYSLSMKHDGFSVSHKNLAECIGASCDKEAALQVQEEEHFRQFSELDFNKVNLQESGASTLSSALVAMIALTGVVGTLV